MKDSLKRLILEISIYLILFVGMGLSLAYFGGLSLQGFEPEIVSGGAFNVSTYFGKLVLYFGLLLLSIILPVFSVMNYVFIKDGEKPWTQDNPAWYRILTVSNLWNPENGVLAFIFKGSKSQKEIKWLRNITRIFFVSTLIASLLGFLIALNPQFAISSLPKQQITATSDVIFTAFIPSIAENAGLIFTINLILGVLAYFIAKYVRKENRDLTYSLLSTIFVSALGGVIWMLYHSLVYGNSESGLYATFIFGTISTLLIILTGIFIWFFMIHFFNNFSLGLIEYITIKEDIIVFYVIGWLILLGFYSYFEYSIYKRKNKSLEQQLVS